MKEKPLEEESPSSDVEKGISQIKWCYQAGQTFAENRLSRLGVKKMKELARAMGIPEEDARRYVQFVRGYRESDLEAIYALCRATNFALSFTHFRIFIGVKNRTARAELERQAIQGRLGTVRTRQLKDRLVNNRSPQGGRKSQLLKLDELEVEWLVNEEVDKIRRHLRLVLAHRCDMQPDILNRMQQLLDRLE